MKPPILVVDDSLTFRETLAGHLEAHGHRVLKAESAEEGLRVAAASKPWAFIVDGVLPGMDGSAFIRRIRLDSAFRTAPCVLLTAAQEDEAELRALDSGADAFVRKDDDIEVILAKLAVVLRTPDGEPEQPVTLPMRTVLIVDDSPTYRHALSGALSEEGHDIVHATNGAEALEVLSSKAIDCILLDLVMPVMDGKEACRRIKSNPATRDVPVLVLTSMESREAMLEGLAVGADDYIPKSAEIEVLKARVRAQLRRREFELQTRRAREVLVNRQIEESEAHAARELAETRALLVKALEDKNAELSTAYAELQEAQTRLVHAAKMASLGELVAGVAHEINNPLSFAVSHLATAQRCLEQCEVLGMVPTDTAKPQWDKANNRLLEMSQGLERIRELVVKLRTFSRLDEGERKTVGVRECVESVLTILRHRVPAGVELSTEFCEDDQLDCYPGPLNQAIMNIVSNAIDAVGLGGSISVSTLVEGGFFVIAVDDNGPGIPEDIRDRVMDPFFTTKGVGQGTGLGLSITYTIAQKHAGDLTLSPSRRGGTRATLRIPLNMSRGSA